MEGYFNGLKELVEEGWRALKLGEIPNDLNKEYKLYYNDVLCRPKKARSLNPSPSVRLYAEILEGWRIFNLKRKINKLPTVSLNWYCYNKGIDITGRSLIKNKYL